MKGNLHLKRALEVAIAGGVEITVVGHPDDGKDLLQVIYPALQFLQPCPCGFYGNPVRECTCSVRQITQYRRRSVWQKASTADILSILHTPRSIDYEERGESWDVVQDRIAWVAQCSTLPTWDEVDGLGRELLRLAIIKLGLTAGQVTRIHAVAGTIAALDRSTILRVEHISEAIQYQTPRS